MPAHTILTELKTACANTSVTARNFGTGGQDGSLMIDMTRFKDFEMDTTTWRATFGAGYKLGELDKKLHKYGKRAMAHGTCPGVGVGGHLTVVSRP